MSSSIHDYVNPVYKINTTAGPFCIEVKIDDDRPLPELPRSVSLVGKYISVSNGTIKQSAQGTEFLFQTNGQTFALESRSIVALHLTKKGKREGFIWVNHENLFLQERC